MVYGYKTNKEFIDKTHILLDKLEKEGVWDKNTLIIGLDKSVRPLAYTLKKISDTEKMDTPNIRFFNFSSSDYFKISSNRMNQINSHLKKEVNPNKLSKYKKILILDEYAYTGKTLSGAVNILHNYLLDLKNKPKIYLAVLSKSKKFNLANIREKFIFASNRGDSLSNEAVNSGIADKYTYYDLKYGENLVQKSKVLEDENHYKEFVQNRKQLSKDIDQYLQEKQGNNENSSARKSLEKAVQIVSIIAFFGGIMLSYKSITGNVIGNYSSTNILGIALIVLGILGLIIFRKFKK